MNTQEETELKTDNSVNENLLTENSDTLIRMLLARSRVFGLSADEAEDIVQEVFIELYDDLITSKAKIDNVNYLYKAALWILTKKIRFLDKFKHKVYEQIEDLKPEEIPQEIYPNSEQAIFHREINNLIEKNLTEQEKMLFNLKYVEDFTTREIAELIGMPPNEVNIHSVKLRRKLSNLLKNNNEIFKK